MLEHVDADDVRGRVGQVLAVDTGQQEQKLMSQAVRLSPGRRPAQPALSRFRHTEMCTAA